MYCNNCGSEVEQTKFCPNCGNPINNVDYSNVIKYEVETFTLFSAYKSMFKNNAKFDGRSRRSEYCLALVANMIISIAIIVAYGVVLEIVVRTGGDLNDIESGPVGITVLFFIVLFGSCIYWIATIIPLLAISSRRLHDIGKSAWVLTGVIIIPILPYYIFELFLTDSQPGLNKYGPNPKGM